MKAKYELALYVLVVLMGIVVLMVGCRVAITSVRISASNECDAALDGVPLP